MRRKYFKNGTRAWIAMLRNSAWGIALLLYIAVISGCDHSPLPSSTLQQPSPTIPKTVLAQPFHDTLKTLDGAFTITLDITPNHSGANIFQLRVMNNQTGKPASHVTITLYTTMQDMTMGTDSMGLHADGAGYFSSTSENLSMAGHWAMGIAIQTSDHVIHKAGVSFVMAV